MEVSIARGIAAQPMSKLAKGMDDPAQAWEAEKGQDVAQLNEFQCLVQSQKTDWLVAPGSETKRQS